MRVFVDTNILIDFVCNRQGFSEAAERLFAYGCVGKVKLMTSALSYVTVMYVARKESLLSVSKFVEVLDLSATTVISALSSDWVDYEDATQNRTAVEAMADCIVTRNKKDFKKSVLPVYNTTEWLDIFENE